ncbi:MAG: biotin/lipoyl-binding protein [Anaerolineae bacterium]|jgi:biotin carboxyl carrier protein
MKYIATVGDQEFTIDVNREGEVTVNGTTYAVDMQGVGSECLYSLIVDGKSYDIFIDERDENFLVVMWGGLFEVQVQDERTRRLAGLRRGPVAPVGEVLVKAPMPGVVTEVPVRENQPVEAGDIVVVMESMKMMNEFKTPRAGVVHNVRVKVGDKVDQNQIMVTIS